eukprot:GHRQ01022360.1.p1 GENE.GHRQ01022360.1~~GHRQ01022360.1.p1  ORF type:complete len:143 (-),score=28.18 GHRQ01022360.1:41-469(-)
MFSSPRHCSTHSTTLKFKHTVEPYAHHKHKQHTASALSRQPLADGRQCAAPPAAQLTHTAQRKLPIHTGLPHTANEAPAAPSSAQLAGPGGASRSTSALPPATRHVSLQQVLVNSLLWLMSSTPPSNDLMAPASAPSASRSR